MLSALPQVMEAMNSPEGMFITSNRQSHIKRLRTVNSLSYNCLARSYLTALGVCIYGTPNNHILPRIIPSGMLNENEAQVLFLQSFDPDFLPRTSLLTKAILLLGVTLVGLFARCCIGLHLVFLRLPRIYCIIWELLVLSAKTSCLLTKAEPMSLYQDKRESRTPVTSQCGFESIQNSCLYRMVCCPLQLSSSVMPGIQAPRSATCDSHNRDCKYTKSLLDAWFQKSPRDLLELIRNISSGIGCVGNLRIEEWADLFPAKPGLQPHMKQSLRRYVLFDCHGAVAIESDAAPIRLCRFMHSHHRQTYYCSYQRSIFSSQPGSSGHFPCV